ncbi:uncharacterized protein A4U43_C01F2230 [Asparagus officinalis]|uniref:Bifunctional inhibitor/plant lipid transfer protein/seed storage helical domain-containing protein n=1 Tax=Asparagus officinalis TaxID=4686 RepID=A0A5P1FLD1_ASPOF|nr:uncharacterized protein A4U43_C01F2230 [Asparagus officinalis]
MKPSAASMYLVLLAWAIGAGLFNRPVVAQGSCPTVFYLVMLQFTPCSLAVAPFGPSPPSSACCKAIRSMGQACLCSLLNGPPLAGVDRNAALQLPSKCVLNYEPCIIINEVRFSEHMPVDPNMGLNIGPIGPSCNGPVSVLNLVLLCACAVDAMQASSGPV